VQASGLKGTFTPAKGVSKTDPIFIRILLLSQVVPVESGSWKIFSPDLQLYVSVCYEHHRSRLAVDEPSPPVAAAAAAAAADFLFIGGRRLTAADIEHMPPEVIEAGLSAARSLQQLPGIFNNLGGWLSGAANAINNVPMPRVDTSRLGNLPFLPQLLPNGTNNPLFNTLKDVTGGGGA
jgi:hypothetical protein